jgi:glycosyltransferase involved in cell wall biosynthesis
MRHTVIMIATSYPRFAGDGVGSFMEPIAKSVAARNHDVHLVAPWHPLIDRRPSEDGVVFHFYRYAPVRALNVFGYAAGMRADTNLRASAWLAAPLALAAGWATARRVAARHRATVLHGHWVVPGGVMAATARGGRPLVISLHGSDVYVAERHRLVGAAARAVFRRAGWITACSDDLRRRAIALGADPARIETVPYGVDTGRFAPSADIRQRVRAELGVGDAPLVFSAGRLVSKKGFEYLIDATALLAGRIPGVHLAIAGDGDLRDALGRRARGTAAVTLVGSRTQDDVGRLAAAADVVAVPSIHDAQGNVDGLPNFALEAMATGTPVVATRVGGLPQAIEDGVTGRLVPERDALALAEAIASLLSDPRGARRIGEAARAAVTRQFGWDRVAERFEAAYDRVVLSLKD